MDTSPDNVKVVIPSHQHRADAERTKQKCAGFRIPLIMFVLRTERRVCSSMHRKEQNQIESEIPSSTLAAAREQRNAQKRRAERARGLRRQAMSKARRRRPYHWMNKKAALKQKAVTKDKINRLKIIKLICE